MAKTTKGHLKTLDGVQLAYNRTVGQSPGVVFLGGYMSDMTGTKALSLERFCQENNQSFVRFDYRGHGASSGSLKRSTITAWTTDALAIIDSLTEGPQILVGSSMGGWIMILAALARKNLISALVGVAAAPDFTERLLEEELSEEQLLELNRAGSTHIYSPYSEEPYLFTKLLLEDGQANLVLGETINFECPVRLLHGLKDSSVPWQTSIKLAEALNTTDVEVTLIKHGDHRLSDPASLDSLIEKIQALS
tara:strand:+ start:994 stop:1743 length:750 start_codon:yes stop_codon:yes gene_type:complete